MSKMPKKGYSGGRLLALGLAEALAKVNISTELFVDNIPEMYDEFRSFSKIKITPTLHFSNIFLSIDKEIDYILIVPHSGRLIFYWIWILYAKVCNAKIILLNFETPNWFNSLSPYKRSEALWAGWRLTSKYASMILSISKEGMGYAKKYYKHVPPNCVFTYSYPGINSIVADQAKECKDRKKQIILLTRIDLHKGFDALHALLDKKLKGYRVIICIGNGKFPKNIFERWKKKFHSYGMDLEIKYQVKGKEKYELLKESSLLFFPTLFEGFGLPPLEAAYCKLPVACSNLPVLKEFGRSSFNYGDPRDVESMRGAILLALNDNNKMVNDFDRLASIARIEEWGHRLKVLLDEASIN